MLYARSHVRMHVRRVSNPDSRTWYTGPNASWVALVLCVVLIEQETARESSVQLVSTLHDRSVWAAQDAMPLIYVHAMACTGVAMYLACSNTCTVNLTSILCLSRVAGAWDAAQVKRLPNIGRCMRACNQQCIGDCGVMVAMPASTMRAA